MASSDSDGDDLLQAASRPYVQCERHAAEMMEKSIACLSCSKLVCALCMRDAHLNHEIISVMKLRDCMALREKVADDLHELQVLQERLQKQMEERKNILKTIEVSSNNLCDSIDASFEELQSILRVKKEEIKKYVTTFRDKNISHVKVDLKELENKHKNSTKMIQKVITCTTKPQQRNVKDLLSLPTQLKSMLEKSQLMQKIENKDALLAETKFSKVLPSLQAVANICQSLHPEATKVVWSKVTPDRKDNGHKRKSHPSVKALKKMKRSSSSESAESRQNTPEPGSRDDPPVLQCNHSNINSPQSTSVPHPATSPILSKMEVCDASERTAGLPDSSTGTPDRNGTDNRDYKMINLNLVAVSQGHFVMGQNGNELNIGKVIEVTQLHSLHFVSVQWYEGTVGQSKIFTVAEKWIKNADLVNSEGLICSFTFDPVSPISSRLEKELIRAGQEFNINGSVSSPFAKRVRITKSAHNTSVS